MNNQDEGVLRPAPCPPGPSPSLAGTAAYYPGKVPNSIRIGPSSHGLGAFASKGFEKGSLLGHYWGELLDTASFDARYPGPASDTSYVYTLRARPGLLVIDAIDPEQSSWCRFINSAHGSGLSNNTKFARHVYFSMGRACVEVRATKKIRVGEELLISYGRYFSWA